MMMTIIIIIIIAAAAPPPPPPTTTTGSIKVRFQPLFQSMGFMLKSIFGPLALLGTLLTYQVDKKKQFLKQFTGLLGQLQGPIII